MRDGGVQLFSTAPQSTESAGAAYLARVADVARWSERHGCAGILIYSDNRLVDPWLVAQVILQQTDRLWPLVAVQPAYTHPYTVAKQVASLAHLYGRRVVLNMVAGGFRNDLLALNDETPHDRRYARLIEYTEIIARLCAGAAVTYQGAFYRVTQLRLTPRPPPDLAPRVFVSGSSAAGTEAARALGATAIRYPRPADEDEPPAEPGLELGARLGLVTRASDDEAWREALDRFPEDRKGQLTHQLAMKVSDSEWHRQLSEQAHRAAPDRDPYWLVPFENYQTMCPYLVGGYDRVADALGRYLGLGYRTFILDIPRHESDLFHAAETFRRAGCLVGA